MKSRRIEEIDIAKGIGIILVVIGHSFPDANTGIQNPFGAAVFDWIYSFHMALFMAMAGMLFYTKSSECITFGQKLGEIKKRVVRLVIPYMFYSFLIFALKAVSSLGRSPVSIGTILDILFGNSPCGNMWFMWTLFIVSILVLFIPTIRGHEEIWVVISAFLFLFQNSAGWVGDYGIRRILSMFVWFMLGLAMKKNMDFFITSGRKISTGRWGSFTVLFFAMHMIVFFFERNLEDGMAAIFFEEITAFLGVCMIFSLSSFIVSVGQSLPVKNALCTLGRDSMEIYVLSYFVQTPGVTVYAKMGTLGIPYILWIICLAVGAMVFSYIAAKVIKRNGILKLVMLGEK